MPPTSCSIGQAGLSPSARQPLLAPKLCLGLWTQLGESLCPGEGQGFYNSLQSTCLPTSQASRFIFPRGRAQPQVSDPATPCTAGRDKGRKGGSITCSRWGLAAAETIHCFCIHWHENRAEASLPKIWRERMRFRETWLPIPTALSPSFSGCASG